MSDEIPCSSLQKANYGVLIILIENGPIRCSLVAKYIAMSWDKVLAQEIIIYERYCF